MGVNSKSKGKDSEVSIPPSEEVESVVMVNISTLRFPVGKILTYEEVDEYDYDLHSDVYYIMINRAPSGNNDVYSNVKVKCNSIMHRETVLKAIETALTINSGRVFL